MPLPAGLATNPFSVAADYGSDFVEISQNSKLDFAGKHTSLGWVAGLRAGAQQASAAGLLRNTCCSLLPDRPTPQSLPGRPTHPRA